MSKNIKCITRADQAAWEALVKLNEGNPTLAFQQWEDNGRTMPAEAIAMVSEDVLNNDYILDEVLEIDPVLIQKQSLISQTRALLDAKLQNLDKILEDHPHPRLQDGRDELAEVLNNIDINEADQTLVDFVSVAQRMTDTADTWLEQFESGEKIPTLAAIKRLEEYVASFSILKELTSDLVETQEHKDIIDTASTLVARHQNIRQSYLKMSRKLIAEQLKGNFNKVYALYEVKAELAFNKERKPFLAKKEVKAGRREFIANYMAQRNSEIKRQTEAYIQAMLLSTTDISTLASWIVNPKDLNHDLINVAVEALDKTDFEVWQTMSTVVDKSDELNSAFINAVGKRSNPKEQYEALLVPGTSRIISPIDDGFVTFRDTYKDQPAVWNLYQHLTSMIKEKDKMVYAGARLGYQLPFIEQGGLERMSDRGAFVAVREGIKDSVKLRQSDIELGILTDEQLNEQKREAAIQEISVNEAGQERMTIPLFYRNTTMEEKNMSYDVVTSMTLDYHNSLKFKAKAENAIFLEAIKDVIHEASIIQTTSFGRKMKVNKDTSEVHTMKGASNLERAITSIIEHRVYGIGTKGDPKLAKRLQSLGKATSFVTMSGNALSGAVNYLHGSTMSWIESAGTDSGFFGKSDRLRAAKQYDKDLKGIIGDMGAISPKSKTNLLMRHFNAFSESDAMGHKSFIQNNKAKRHMTGSALYAFNSSGEHIMNSVATLATLNNVKVIDANGNFLDADFKPTMDRSKAIGVPDAMEVVEGKLMFNAAVAKTEKTDGVGTSDVFKLSQRVRRVTRDLYGNYDSENKSELQRTATGGLLTQMRGWLVAGVQKRYKGAGTVGLFNKNEQFLKLGEEFTMDNLHRLNFNSEVNEFEEGQYITTLRFMRSVQMELKTLGLIAGSKENWNKMTDKQRGNIKKTVLEAGVMIAALLLSQGFEDDPDDPDDMSNIYAAYISRRIYSELFSFANPHEALRTFRSPAIAISTVEAGWNVAVQLYSPLEVYETGSNAGENRLITKVGKLVPVYKQFNTSIQDKYNFLKR